MNRRGTGMNLFELTDWREVGYIMCYQVRLDIVVSLDVQLLPFYLK